MGYNPYKNEGFGFPWYKNQIRDTTYDTVV